MDTGADVNIRLKGTRTGFKVTRSINQSDGIIYILNPKSEPIKRSIMYGGSNEWNNLDADIRNTKVMDVK